MLIALSVSKLNLRTVPETVECLRYLREPCTSALDCLNSYPTVKLLFRKLNCTVPSSALVERLFSKGSLGALPRRNRLNDKHFAAADPGFGEGRFVPSPPLPFPPPSPHLPSPFPSPPLPYSLPSLSILSPSLSLPSLPSP